MLGTATSQRGHRPGRCDPGPRRRRRAEARSTPRWMRDRPAPVRPPGGRLPARRAADPHGQPRPGGRHRRNAPPDGAAGAPLDAELLNASAPSIPPPSTRAAAGSPACRSSWPSPISSNPPIRPPRHPFRPVLPSSHPPPAAPRPAASAGPELPPRQPPVRLQTSEQPKASRPVQADPAPTRPAEKPAAEPPEAQDAPASPQSAISMQVVAQSWTRIRGSIKKNYPQTRSIELEQAPRGSKKGPCCWVSAKF